MIVGDIPIFVALDSADVWVNRDQFQMDAAQPKQVAGVPPDAFSKTGQRWGNPLYDWERMAKTGYRWWLDRFKATAGAGGHRPARPLPGVRGVLVGARPTRRRRSTARWVPGPGAALFDALAAELGRSR